MIPAHPYVLIIPTVCVHARNRFCGDEAEFWQPGEDWYTPTDETRTVEVFLSFRLIEGVKA